MPLRINNNVRDINIQTLLFYSKDALLLIEHLLERESKVLENLRKQEPKNEKVLAPQQAHKLFREVKEYVINFLGSAKIEPRLIYHNPNPKFPRATYFPLKNTIEMQPRKKGDLVSILAHEYAHHIQYHLREDLFHSLVLSEGMARGVERVICSQYANAEDFVGCLIYPQDKLVGELKSVYRKICFQLKIKPKKRLLKISSSVDKVEEWMLQKQYRLPTEHATGNIFFYLLELSYGNQIYIDFLKNN